MKKKNKIFILIALILTVVCTITIYGLSQVLKYSQCEQEVFRNPEYAGGKEFKALLNKCIKEENIISLIREEKE